MSFLELLDEASALLRPFVDLYVKDIDLDLQEPSNPEFGDLASGVSFRLSKLLGGDPSDTALRLAGRISPPEAGSVRSVEANGGFINFHINVEHYAQKVLGRILSEGQLYGVPRYLEPRKILIEHTNSNPNKALHIGTARNTVLGDTLCRILRYVGSKVISVNYVDDSGSQVADNILAHLRLDIPQEPPKGKSFDAYAGETYASISNRVKSDPTLEEEKRKIIREIELGSNPTATFARNFAERVVGEQLKTCWRLGAYFDLLNWESDILRAGMFQEVIERLEGLGRVERPKEGRNSGCIMIKLRDVKEFEHLTEPDEVLVRSDGTATYVGKDVAYAAWKLGLVNGDFRYRPFVAQPEHGLVWTTTQDGDARPPERFNGADVAVTLVDKRQEHPQMVVSSALGFLAGQQNRYRPFLYEVVALSGETASELTGDKSLAARRVVHMSGRSGLVINADSVLDLLERQARDESQRRNPSMSDFELDRVGKEISRAAFRFALLKTDISNMVVFSTSESLRFEGDSGPYLQYTYARASSIMRKAGPMVEGRRDASLLSHETERTLIKELSKFPFVVKEATGSLNPKPIATLVLKLADRFNLFYENCQVIGKTSPELKDARLALVRAFIIVFGTSLQLLGITPLEEM